MFKAAATRLRTPLPLLVTHILVLAGAALLVGVASADTFESRSFAGSEPFRRMQLWICIFFMADIITELIYSHDKRHFIPAHIVMFIACVPYVSLLGMLHVTAPGEWQFVLALIPVIRGIYVLGVVLLELNAGRLNSFFGSCLALLLLIVYFSSLMFYIAESDVNPSVHSFRSALYWAVMSMTTTGSQITEYTSVGEAVAAVLSATGLVLFPVFTVYIAGLMKTPK